MTYSLLRHTYDSSLLLGKVVTKLWDYRAFAWMMEAHFSMGTNGLQVRSLKVNSGRSRLEVAGRLLDFRQPRIEATYHASVDLAEAAAIARRGEMRRGTAELQGGGSWSVQQFSTEGKLLVKDFDWHDQSLNLSSVTVSSDFSASPERLASPRSKPGYWAGAVPGRQKSRLAWFAPGEIRQAQTRRGAKGNGRDAVQGFIRWAVGSNSVRSCLPTPADEPGGRCHGHHRCSLEWLGA